jgi:D-alanyl-D-alanine carboxypeptidase/D-alanyl-D-alanine-endopeptidase (penicillin-binding protein 4)
VRNAAKTTSSSRRHKVIVDRLNGSHVVSVSGAVFQHAAPVEAWVTVPDPLAYFAAAMRRAFVEEGLEVEGRVLFSRHLPVAHWEWAAGYRTDLMTTAEVINKRSQNFFAESLLKLMGAELCGEGSWEAGRRVVEEFLESLDIAPGTYQLADGSGMSRHNLFTARQITSLLRYMYFHPRGRDFLLTLPYSGEPGLKWERRLAEPPYRGNVFAKTGSLLGVSTLSGYVKARSGRIYAFSILCNRTRANWRAQRAQDAIVQAVVNHG